MSDADGSSRLREAMQALVPEVDGTGVAERVLRRVRRRRHRRLVLGGLAMASAVVAGAALLLSVADQPSGLVVVDEPDSTDSVATSAPDRSDIVLRGDGLGIIRFGDPAADVIDALSAVLGPPSLDVPIDRVTTLALEGCAGETSRVVTWDRARLSIGIESGPGDVPRVVAWAHYFGGRSWDPVSERLEAVLPEVVLATEVGVTLDSSLADVEAAYGSGFDEASRWRVGAIPQAYRIGDPSGAVFFAMPGEDLDGSAVDSVQVLTAGQQCGVDVDEPPLEPLDQLPPTSLLVDVSPLVLRGDGLGIVAFGASPADAIAAISAVFGPPTADDTQPDAVCFGAGSYRWVSWGVLTLLFTDGGGTRPMQFDAWSAGSDDVIGRTPDGVDPADPYSYWDAVYEIDYQPFGPEGPNASISDPTGRLLLRAELEADVVHSVQAGMVCGP